MDPANGQELEETFQVYLIIFTAFTSPLIVVFNLLAITTLLINRHLRKKSVYFVINLAITDFLFGAVLAPVMCTELMDFNPVHSNLLWIIRGRIFLLLSIIHFASLALISLDRMCATVWPLRYRIRSPRLYFTCCFVTWLVGAVFASVELSGTVLVCLRVVGLTVLLVITVSYLAIFIKMRIQNNQIASGQQRSIQKDRHLVKTLLLVTLTSIIVWVPVMVVLILKTFIQVKDGVYLTVGYIGGLNPLLDPIIYIYRVKEYKRALKKLVCKCSRDRPVFVQPA
ncbi:predicted protein [Nematostella vectensis]|uniref:G-protein coupled receptors family 1 profile domain-containing protein n=1 Tax=Nematostella vectensis TaxID=45351 RepID=A7SH33_NEMVE|nr:predicted protein [Nematostella vectensis]EDO36979.1 predicted protein [Nematostella vectensis]|eukprot:XP_001629041.1 predicted protein [Nematostella vectensis]